MKLLNKLQEVKHFIENTKPRAIKALKEAKLRMKLSSIIFQHVIDAKGVNAVKWAKEGKQFGWLSGMLYTNIWFVDMLREEYKDAPVQTISIDRLTCVNQFAENTAIIQEARVEAADVSYPIYVTEDLAIVDGRHRTRKALANGQTEIQVIIVGAPHLELWNHEAKSLGIIA